MTHVAERLRGLLEHRRNGEFVNDAILDALCDAYGDAMERLGLVAFGDVEEGIEGPRVLRDPSVAPAWAIRHAAMYTGAMVPGRMAGETEEDWLARARDEAVYPAGIRRGTHEAVRRAVKPHLTSTKSVFIADNYGDEYGILVRTIEAETPDPAVVAMALTGSFVSGGQRGAIRAELLLTYLVADVVTFAEASLRFNEVADGITAENVTRDDVT